MNGICKYAISDNRCDALGQQRCFSMMDSERYLSVSATQVIRKGRVFKSSLLDDASLFLF